MKNIEIMKKIFLTSILIGSMIAVTACGNSVSEGKKQEEIQTIESVSEVSEATTGDSNDEDENEKFVGNWIIDIEQTEKNLKQSTLQGMFGSGFASGNGVEIQNDGNMKYYVGIGVDDGSGTYTINGNVLTYVNANDGEVSYAFTMVELDGVIYLKQDIYEETLYWKQNEVENGNLVPEDSTVDETKQVLDGYYVSCMTGTEKGVIFMEVVDGALHIKGTFVYDADADKASDKYYNEYYCADKVDVGEYIFLLSADTQFIASGGEADSKYDRQKFEKSYCTQPDLGLGLYITVENGIVTKIETAS